MNQHKIKKQDVPQVLESHLPEYKPQLLKLKSTLGMTNQTFKVTAEGLDTIIFRILNPIIDREYQNKVLMKLGQKQICPKNIYNCLDYRIEQFVQNARHPSTHEINQNQDLLKRVLNKVFQVHQIKLPAQLKKNFFDHIAFSKEGRQNYQKTQCAEAGKEQQFKKHKEYLLGQFQKVKESIQEHYKQRKHKLKLCHNDLNNNNIFLKKIKNKQIKQAKKDKQKQQDKQKRKSKSKQKKNNANEQENNEQQVVLIDFQYACLNYTAYDIANLLNQCSFDYQKKAPGFKVYKNVSLQQIKRAVSLYPGKYKNMEKDVNFMLGICNFYWALWSLEAKPTDFFCTMKHCEERIKLYKFYSERNSH